GIGVQIMQAQAQIIDGILDSARALQRVLKAEPRAIAAEVLIDRAIALARQALGPSAPPVEARHEARTTALIVDAARLERAIANLIVKAARHQSSKAPIEVRTHTSAAGADVRIAGAGAGLDVRALGETPLRSAGPAPLDLQTALARQLVELQGGSIVVRAAGTAPP